MRRIGLIGFGKIAENGHLPALQSLAGVQVTAIADVSPERLDRARSLVQGVALYDDPLQLIFEGEVDAVDICTPPKSHVDLILAACERGLPDIVCEKPLVLSEDDYVQVARAKQRSSSRVVSVNNWVHSDLNRHVSEVLDEGMIGSVQSIELRTGRPDCALGDVGWMPRWRTDPAHAGGGIILDHGWHQLYLLLGWMRAPIESVSAMIRTADDRHHPVEDEARIDMSFPAAHGRIELSWTSKGRTNGGLIYGSRGSITIHDDRVVIENGRGRHALPFCGKLTESSYHPEWFEKMFRYNVLDKGRDEAERNFAEAGVVVSAIRAAYCSARERGTPCRPSFPTGDAVSAVLTKGEEVIDVRGVGGGDPA